VCGPLRAEILVTGIVQGVGFRPFIYRIAAENQLKGTVRNRGDAGVEIVVEGSEENVKRFIDDLERKKPPLARIYELSVNYAEDKGEFSRFIILKSSEKSDLSGSIIPPDISICDNCLRELRDLKDRRYGYFFITCTDCGPRYTIIEKLPYDRPNTVMNRFPMCEDCSREYTDPLNRRFHAQTVACPRCGPRVFLTSKDGQILDHQDPIREAGRLLEEGYIVAVKGNGGFHVATSTMKPEPIIRLRKAKHRAQKPFAVMARDLEAVKSFAEVGKEEAALLTSYIKPIVLLKKSENFYLSDLISPGLHNVGVMLPYTGLHYMLFDSINEPALVMTSANPPSEPIIVENQEAVRRLRPVVDFFLMHDRDIAQRCDDSVLRVNRGTPTLIRRSRGYAPAPIHLGSEVKRCALGLGAEENVASCVLSGKRAFISQYIGDVENLETLNYLKSATDHLLKLTNLKVEVIACDLHPKFSTTKFAYELAEKLGCPVVQVQHHHAHIAALMAEHNLTHMIGICCDGFGYGSDGSAWGGEILYCDRDGFRRLAHLQEQPMVGGDAATRYPLRMVAGILHGLVDVEEWLYSNVRCFPRGEMELGVVLRQLESGHAPKTTSCGRVLDAVSALLGLCYERTYEGEPAVKLESAAIKGRDILCLTPKISGGVLDTSYLLKEVFIRRDEHSPADLAYSAESYLARGLAELAVKECDRLGVQAVGFSGGVAYNEHISRVIRNIVEGEGFNFFTHIQIPPGDGGISFGQSVVASWLN
jgi:hydrogenase maturation protein HypF